MRNKKLLRWLWVHLLFLSSSAYLSGFEYTLNFPKDGLKFTKGVDKGTLRIELEGTSPLLDPGKPILPFKTITFLLSEGERIKDVQFEPLEVDTINIDNPLEIYQPILDSAYYKPQHFKLPDVYPQNPLLHFTSGGYLGYPVGSIVFAPLVYNKDKGYLLFYRSAKFTITLQENPDLLKPIRSSPAAEMERLKVIKSAVVNAPMDEPKILQSSDKEGQYQQPTEFPSLEGGPVAMVIVTTDELSGAFEPLRIWHTLEGIPTVIKTTSWIEANYPGGDLSNRIRNFLKDAFQYWGVNWVLIGGEPDLIPKKDLYSYLPGIDSFYYFTPSDRYYQNLETEWDRNMNGILGEFEDSVDLYPDVLLGRIPVRTPAEVQNFLDKFFLYQKNPGNGDPSYLDKLLFMASSIVQEGDGGEICEEVAEHIPDYVTIGRIYEDVNHSPTVYQVIDSLNSGYGIFNSFSHGNFDLIAVSFLGEKSYFYTYHVSLLNNYSRTYFAYNSACNIGGDDRECLNEEVFRSPGGAVAVFSLQRLDFPYIEKNFAKAFFDSLYLSDHFRLKSLLAVSQDEFIPLADILYGYRYEFFGHNLMGDPAMLLWRKSPGVLSIQAPDTLFVGINLFDVTVTDSNTGEPISNATVTIYKENDILLQGVTDINGVAHFNLVPHSLGEIHLLVEERDHIPFEKTILVVGNTAYPSLVGYEIEDSLGGDGDLTPEAGETLSVYLSYSTYGISVLHPVFLKLIPLDNNSVTIVDTGTIPQLMPSETTTVGPLKIFLRNSTPDREKIRFLVRLLRRLPIGITKGPNNSTLSDFPIEENLRPVFDKYAIDTISFTVRAPSLRFLGHRLEGTDTLSLFLEILNQGGDDARDVIVTAKGNVNFVDSSISIGVISRGEFIGGETIPPIRFTLGSTPLDSVMLILNLSHRIGEISDTLRLKNIPAPTQCKAYPLLYGVSLNWATPNDTKIMGFRIYRAFQPEDQPQLLTPIPVEEFTFDDHEIGPGGSAYYWITAIDSFGNESELIGPIEGYSAPPQLEGSPIWVQELKYASPCVFDLQPEIPGLEIVVATRDGEINIFTSTGDPLPNWPISVGIENNFFGSPALGDLDGDGETEIVVAPRGPLNQVLAFKLNGDLAPGWPRPIEGGSSESSAGVFSSPIVADLDNDGTEEVIVKTMLGKIYIWHGDGTGYADSTGLVFDANEPAWGESSPAVGDIDQDDTLEIIFGTRQGELYAIKPHGDIIPGFPVELPGEIMGSIVTGDISPDSPGLEIAFTSYDKLYLVSSMGEILPGWPTQVSIQYHMDSHPSLCDLNQDGRLDVIFNGKDAIYAFDWQGNPIEGFPINCAGRTGSSVTVVQRADTSILFRGDYLGKIHVISSLTQEEYPGFPIFLYERQDVTPTVADVDQDGDFELVIGNSSGRIWLFETGLNNLNLSWPMFRHDVGRTGNYYTAKGSQSLSSLRREGTFSLLGPLPNPISCEGVIKVSLKERSPISLKVYDITGRVVMNRNLGNFLPGFHLLQFDVQDRWGKPLPTGVYFLKIEVGEKKFIKKFSHIR